MDAAGELVTPDRLSRPLFNDRRTGVERRTEWHNAAIAREVHWARRQLLDELDRLLERWQYSGQCPNEEIKSVVEKHRHAALLRQPPAPRTDLCPDCDHGVRGGKPCETCGGSGYA